MIDMCMKYVNINVQCFDPAPNSLLANVGFSSILDSVKAEQKDDKIIIGGFNIVTFINIRGTNDKSKTDNPLNAKKKLTFRVRLTKLDPDETKQISYNLKDFTIDLSDPSVIHRACFEYVERIEITAVKELELESTGPYVIKILVKDENDKLFDVQMLHPLYVK